MGAPWLMLRTSLSDSPLSSPRILYLYCSCVFQAFHLPVQHLVGLTLNLGLPRSHPIKPHLSWIRSDNLKRYLSSRNKSQRSFQTLVSNYRKTVVSTLPPKESLFDVISVPRGIAAVAGISGTVTGLQDNLEVREWGTEPLSTPNYFTVSYMGRDCVSSLPVMK